MLLSDFVRFVEPEVLGCPQPTIELAILNAAREFFSETLTWNEWASPVNLMAGVQDYDLDFPTGAHAVCALTVIAGTIHLRPIAPNDLSRFIPNYWEASGDLPAFYNASIERGSIRVYPIPNGQLTGPLRVQVALAPNLTATSIPDFLLNRHFDVLKSGALARVMAMPGQPWTQPGLAERNAQAFRDFITEGRAEELHGRTVGSLTAQPVAFGFNKR